MNPTKTKTGFSLVLVGLLFFANPTVNLFDIFPDVIGALLMFFGLKQVAEIDSYFEEARRLSFYAIWVYALKLVLSYQLLRYPGNALPYTFMESVAEILLMVLLFTKLFAGFEYVSMRGGSPDTILAVKNTRSFSVLFTVCKCVLTFCPEILELLKQNEEIDLRANAAYRMPIIRLKPYAIVLSVFVQLILGIIFAVLLVKFFRTVGRDKLLQGSLAEKIKAARTLNPARRVKRAIKVSLLFFIAAMVFTVDFTVSGHDIFCDAIGGACLIASFAAVRRFGKKQRLTALSAALFAVFSVLSTLLSVLLLPDAFTRLAGERTFAKDAGKTLLAEPYIVPLVAVYCAVFAICAVFAYFMWMRRQQTVYAENNLGCHDRKLLTVSLFAMLAAVSKNVAFALQIALGHLSYQSEVAAHISARPRMNPETLRAALVANPLLARFEALDTAASILHLLTAVLAVFVVFSAFTLMDRVTGRDTY